MALNYSVSLRPNPLDKDAAPKAYATSQINGELTVNTQFRAYPFIRHQNGCLTKIAIKFDCF